MSRLLKEQSVQRDGTEREDLEMLANAETRAYYPDQNHRFILHQILQILTTTALLPSSPRAPVPSLRSWLSLARRHLNLMAERKRDSSDSCQVDPVKEEESLPFALDPAFGAKERRR